MNIPIPPLIIGDSHNSKLKSNSFFPLFDLTLPQYESTSDILDPVPGMLVYIQGNLAVYEGTDWQTVQVSTGTWTQQGSKLIGTGATPPGARQGSVSLSADGNTLAVGGYFDDNQMGAVWIFTRSAGVWTQQGPKLVGTGWTTVPPATYPPDQGYALNLSGDGNTLAIGGSVNNDFVGGVCIFVRNSGVWSQQSPVLIGSGYVFSPMQGYGLSLSTDGNTLAIGGGGDDNGIGATWIFTRSGGVWTQQGSKLIGTGYVGLGNQGNSVALSGDGNTLVVGGYLDDTGVGATWVFVRNAGVWSQQGSKLIGTGYVGLGNQGYGIGISADGNTLAIGGPYDDNNLGATWIFTRNGGIWAQQGSKLIGTGYVGTNIYQGYGGVFLSGNGNILAIGAYGDDGNLGAAWIFNRSGSTWTQQGSKLVGSGYIGNPNFCHDQYFLSLSADGTTLAMGGIDDDGLVGAAWVFTQS